MEGQEEFLRKAIETYFTVLKEHGRTVSKNIKPAATIFANEKPFLKYLDKNDLYCMFCNELLEVIVIDYKLQRPVWGCRKDKFTKGLQKIKWSNHCAECGAKLDLDIDELEEQNKHMEQDNVKHVCEKCIGNGNILTDEDLKKVEFKKPTN